MIWITQAQYDAIMVSIGKIAIPDDLRDVAIYVPPVELRLFRPEAPTLPPPSYRVPVARFRPVLVDPNQSKLLPPVMRWELVTPHQIVPEFLAIQMQSR